MTVSEERLDVGTERREAGRARLRKYVVTENVTQTVPVQREEVRVEREPITDTNRDDALSGPGISEDEHEVVLHEERPVVDKDTVPVERVRLDTETVTDQVTVRRRGPQGTRRFRRRHANALTGSPSARHQRGAQSVSGLGTRSISHATSSHATVCTAKEAAGTSPIAMEWQELMAGSMKPLPQPHLSSIPDGIADLDRGGVTHDQE